MNAIVIVDRNWGIGKNNDLLFSLKGDMKHFRETTQGRVVVMGSNTLLSFPESKPLKNRVNVVLWPGGNTRSDCTVVQSLDELKQVLQAFPASEIFVVGGAMFYRTMLPFCEKVYVTKADADGEAQVFFENLDKLPNWVCAQCGEEQTEGDIRFRFCTYENTSPEKF